MRDLTYICAFYLNQGQLREQQRIWSEYPADLKVRFHAIVTDDCSPHSPAREVFTPVGNASYQLYRAGVDKRWNWLFCRNLGVAKAKTDWVLLTDIDHVLPAETLRALLTMKLDAANVYRLSRVDAPHPAPWSRLPADRCDICEGRSEQYIRAGCVHGPLAPYAGGHVLTPYKAHPNTWLMTRQMFDRIGGYDERFSGFYGSDSEFRERVEHTAERVVLRPEVVIRYPREVIPDASTTTYKRKQPEDGVNVPRIKAERALIKNWRPLRVTLPYRLEASA